MRIKTGLVAVALMGSVLGGVLVGTVADNAQAADDPSQQSMPRATSSQASTPLFVTASSSPISKDSGVVTWNAPIGKDVEQVLAYKVTLTPEGVTGQSIIIGATPPPLPAPLTIPTRNDKRAYEGYAQLPTLAEKTSYKVEVQALVTSKATGKRMETQIATTVLKTDRFLY